MRKLLSEGKTDLLTGFKSARTGRLFKAYLVLDPKAKKIGFEFEAKAPKVAKAKAADDADEAVEKKAPAKKTASKTATKAKTTKAAASKSAASKAKTTRAKKADTSNDAPPDDNPPLSAYDDEPPF